MDGEKYQNLLTKEEVLKILNKKCKDAKMNSYLIRPVSDDPMGFLGELYYLKINVDSCEQLSFFIKRMPNSVPAHLKYAQETKAFFKEIELYKTLFEDIKELQDKLTLDTRWCPDYFYSKGCELLVLEDLSVLGYRLFEERQVLDKAHVVESAKAMARMHAGSFIFEDRLKKKEIKSRSMAGCEGAVTIEQMYPHLMFETEAVDTPGHSGNALYEAGFKSELVLLDYLQGYSAEDLECIRENLIPVMRRLLQMVKPSNKYKNIYIHGDLWSNNIMYRYDHNNQVNHAIIVDYQLGRYAPPAHELQMFLHLTLSREYRVDNEQDIIQLYYNTLTHELQQYNIDVSTVLPLQQFLDSCQYYQEFAALSAATYFQLILLPPNISSKMLSSVELFQKYFFVDRSEIVLESFLSDEANRKRMLDGLREVVDKYVLKRDPVN